MAKTSSRSRILDFLLIFAVAYFGSQFIFNTFFPQENAEQQTQGVILSMQDETVREGHAPIVNIQNATSGELTLPERCPMPSVDVFRVTATGTGEALTRLETTEVAIPCTVLPVIAPGATQTYDLSPWKYSLFGEYGTYVVGLNIDQSSGSGAVAGTQTGSVISPVSVRFTVHEPGAIVKMFRTFVTKPMLNALVLIAGILPGHNLGIAIILLTLLIKLLLFLPTQHAMEGQRKLQAIQPKIEQIRKQYAGDNVRIQQETMKLWKEEKVNPFQSCLPTLIQFPILIGLFFVIRDGSVLETSREFLYAMHQDLPWSFGTHFLGLDLRHPNITVMPILLVVLQFVQMKLSFAKTKKAKQKEVTMSKDGKVEKAPADMQQKIMLYVLPLMIGFFALQFPAAVSLYWGVSTLFAIGQQIIVNREKIVVKNA